MSEDLKLENRWSDRNEALETYRATGSFGWVHLVIGQNKITKNKFLRLKRYMNWFSIPSPAYLAVIQKMIKEGADKLGWTIDEMPKLKLEKATEREIKNDNKLTLSNNDEINAFIKEYPEFTKKVLSAGLHSVDPKIIVEFLEIIDEAIKKSGDRFKVAFTELLPKITAQDPKSMFELSDLMKKWNLFQITSLTNLIKVRIDTIETLSNMIHDSKTYELKDENSIHRILEKNMWLVDETYWIVQSNQSLRTYIGDELEKRDAKYKKRRPDFVCVNRENKIIILEIKRPSVTLAKDELDQAELYQRLIKKYKTGVTVEVYLIGSKVSLEAREIADFRRGLTLKTYQDFLDSCRVRYREYLKITESEK